MFSWLKRFFGGSGSTTSEAGARGEKVAADWLKTEKGFSIVARNWRNPADRREEIDLVARDGEALVFIEVKTRAAGALVAGFHAIDARKKRVLRRAVGAYLARLGPKAERLTFRFDVVEVTLAVAGSAGGAAVAHFENVALFPAGFRP